MRPDCWARAKPISLSWMQALCKALVALTWIDSDEIGCSEGGVERCAAKVLSYLEYPVYRWDIGDTSRHAKRDGCYGRWKLIDISVCACGAVLLARMQLSSVRLEKSIGDLFHSCPFGAKYGVHACPCALVLHPDSLILRSEWNIWNARICGFSGRRRTADRIC
eukprot:IDg2009t1